VKPAWLESSLAPYFATDSVVIYHGKAEFILPQLHAWDHVITDPPYSEEVHMRHRVGAPGGGGDGLRGRKKKLRFEALTPQLRWAMSLLYQRTRRWCLVFGDAEESAPLWRRDLVFHGLPHYRTCFWHKLGATPQLTGDRPAAHVELITCHHNTAFQVRPRWNGKGRGNVFSHLWLPYKIVRGKERPDHDTPKPVPLLEELLSLFTDPREIILDSFGGSGATGLAAQNLGRRCILIDKDLHACEVMRERLIQNESVRRKAS